jgi:hypothetical protein
MDNFFDEVFNCDSEGAAKLILRNAAASAKRDGELLSLLL